MTQEQLQCFAWALGAYFVEKTARALDDAEYNKINKKIVPLTILWHQAIDAFNAVEDALYAAGFDAQAHFERVEEELGMAESRRRWAIESDDGGLYAAYAEQDKLTLRCMCSACEEEEEVA